MNKFKLSTVAFTLTELIVVMIILGVLASLVIKGMLGQIKTQQGQEAINTLTMIRSNIETCGALNNDNFTNCSTFDNNDMSDPSYNAATNPGSKFQYTITAPFGGATSSYSLKAARIVGSAASTTDYITFTRTSGAITCTANGIYRGMC